MSDWGQGAKNNNIGWGQGSVNNDISWGSVHANSWAGDTNIVGFAYDADYQAVLNKAISESFTLPDDAEKLKQNQLVIDLKTAGAWEKADTIFVLATGSNQNFARIDWRNPTHLATLVNSPTFVTKKGFQGGGTSYINTNFNPFTEGIKYKQNNASRYIFMDTASSTGALDGCATVNTNRMIRSNVSTQTINQGSTSLTGGTFNFTNVKGMKSIHRTSDTNVELFNDTTRESRTATSSTMVNQNQFILRSGSDVTPIYGAHTISFYMMGESMISENDNTITAVNTYLNSL
jgi:hypothetical protein